LRTKSFTFLAAGLPIGLALPLGACGGNNQASFPAIVDAAAAPDAGTDVGPSLDAAPQEASAAADSGMHEAAPSLFGDAGSIIRLSPSNATLFIDTATNPPTAATQAYTGTLGGTDVTRLMTLTLANAAVGSFSGQTFTSATSVPGAALGVTTQVRASDGTSGGLANLTVVALRKSGVDRDFYFVEPYKQNPTPANDELKFGTSIQSVDVAVLLDTTGSMEGSIKNVQSNLTSTVLPGLKTAIPDVGVAIVDHRDYPYQDNINDYGGTADYPAKVWQVVTTDASLVQAAVNMYSLGNGGDDPEAQIPAMDYLLTGNALTWPQSTFFPAGSVAQHTPAAGTEGGVDFRPGSFRVVVQISDAPWHNYDGMPADPLATVYAFPAPDYTKLASDFTAMHAKYVGVVDDHSIDSHPHIESQALSDATGSNVPAAAFPGGACNAQGGMAPNGNCRLNFDITDGAGLDTSIVEAIKAISIGATFNVTAIPANDRTNPGGVDATKFIQALRAMGEGDAANGCPKAMTTKSDPSLMYDDVFVGVTAGTAVCFEVIPAINTIVPPTMSAQFFKAFINVVGLPGNTTLDQRSVLFLVPPVDLNASE
jgi:hypothetical protein